MLGLPAPGPRNGTAIALASFTVRCNAGKALYVTGGATLLLLFVGIRDAWDAVAYRVFSKRQERAKPEREMND